VTPIPSPRTSSASVCLSISPPASPMPCRYSTPASPARPRPGRSAVLRLVGPFGLPALARQRRPRGATPPTTLRHPASLRPCRTFHGPAFDRFDEIFISSKTHPISPSRTLSVATSLWQYAPTITRALAAWQRVPCLHGRPRPSHHSALAFGYLSTVPLA